MKIYAARTNRNPLTPYVGKDIWVKVIYRGFYTSNYCYIKITAMNDEHIWFNELCMYAVNKLVGAKLSLMAGDPVSFDVPIDSIRQSISGTPHCTLVYLYQLSRPVDSYTTEELLNACDTLEAAQ